MDIIKEKKKNSFCWVLCMKYKSFKSVYQAGQNMTNNKHRD